jgi:predicted nucleic acid-binding protein
MIVVDASALVAALIEDSERGKAANAALEADAEWAAPRHILVEALAAIRNQVLRGALSAAAATRVVIEIGSLAFDWVEMEEVIDRIWELRDAVTAYDGAYVAAAEHIGCPLVTTDARLARCPGARCSFVVLGSG